MLILFGFKGVGKTYFGKKLAEDLSLPFFDTDEMVQSISKNGMSPKECVLKYGEKAFREWEQQAILSLPQIKGIVALGGGAILEVKNQIVLKKKGKLLYLKVSKEKVKTLPLPASEACVESYYEKRAELYEKIADHVLEIEDKIEETIIEELKNRL